MCFDNGNMLNSWPLNGRQPEAILKHNRPLNSTYELTFWDHYGHIKYADGTLEEKGKRITHVHDSFIIQIVGQS